jgi:O-antigen/teichoic acid export membrane protein/thymidylate kinase
MSSEQAFSLTSWTTRRVGALALLRKWSWGVADQGLISATNFVTMVLLARGLGPASFGAFSLVYGALLFANGIQGALILHPHSVLSAARIGRDYRDYTASTGVAQLLLSAAAVLLAAAVGCVSALAQWPLTPTIFALAPCIIAWQAHEYVRRVLYDERRLRGAFWNDAVCYGGQTMAVAGLWAMEALTAPLALWAMAAASAAAAAVGARQIRTSLTGRVSLPLLAENWRLGKWLTGAEVGYWASSQTYLYLTGLLVGSAAAGVMRAAYVIFGPVRILGFFLRAVLPNSFARALAGDGKAAMHEQVKSVWSGVAPLTAAYCLLAAVFADPLVRVLYGNQFAGHSRVVALYAVFAFVALMTSVITSALRAGRLARHLFISQLWATALALPVGWVLIAHLGIEGAVVGMILTNLVVGLSNYLAYRREQLAPAAPDALSMSRDTAAEDSPASAAAAATLRRVLALLDENGIGYCVLHGYERLDERVSSDVDCLVAAEALPARLAELLRANETRVGARVVQWFRDGAHFIVLAGREDGGAPFSLQLHASADYDVEQRTFYCGHEVLAGRRRARSCWAPAPAVEFGSYLARRVSKGDLRDEHCRRLCELYRQDPAGCRSHAERLWGRETGGVVADAAARNDFGPVLKRGIVRIRAQQNRRALRARPLRVARNVLAAAARRPRRWLRADRGLTVILLGPDGAGKSSVAESLRRDLSGAFNGTERRTFPPGLLRRPCGSNASPHAQRPRGSICSCIRALCYWLPYCALDRFLISRAARARGALQIHDRHFVDALVDPRRYRYGGPTWLLRLTRHLVPTADLVILLDAPAEVIQSRKQEVPLEETRRQRAAYRALITGMHNGHVVDAAAPAPQVAAAVEDVVLDFLARRATGQLGMEAAR